MGLDSCIDDFKKSGFDDEFDDYFESVKEAMGDKFERDEDVIEFLEKQQKISKVVALRCRVLLDSENEEVQQECVEFVREYVQKFPANSDIRMWSNAKEGERELHFSDFAYEGVDGHEFNAIVPCLLVLDYKEKDFLEFLGCSLESLHNFADALTFFSVEEWFINDQDNYDVYDWYLFACSATSLYEKAGGKKDLEDMNKRIKWINNVILHD